jgi:DNA (cytosine-5)-methyltransferase 1
MPKKRLKAVDLFSGAGGLSLGLELGGIDVVGSVEYCDKAVKTYKHNFPKHAETTVCEDITNYPPEKMEELLKEKMGLTKDDIDIIAGGPPCPGFSNIGRSKIISLLRNGGLDKWSWGDKNADELRHTFIQDPRNKLFLEFVSYVKHFQPRWFIMENVPGMLTSRIESGKDELKIVDVVHKAFKNIGYSCNGKPLWANHYGVPQSRQRIIFLGWKDEEDKVEHPTGNLNKEISSLEAISDLPFVGLDGGDFSRYGDTMSRSHNIYQKQMRCGVYKQASRPDPRTKKIPKGDEPLTCHVGRAVNPRDRAIFPELTANKGEKRVTYDMIDPATLKFPDGWRWNKSKQLVWNGKHGRDKKTYKWYNRKTFKDKMRRITAHKPSPTLVAHMAVDTYMYIHPTENRTITPREAARIQSFPDSFDFSVVSFTSQYRQIGNAVPPLMGKAIAEEITKKCNLVPSL